MEKQILINDYASRSFRDLADQDYVAARICYRFELDQLFLWNSLQAIEKYFKAILLFNGRSAKGLWHDLEKALLRIKDISDLSFELPNDVALFIKYIGDYGSNRYFDYPTTIQEFSLFKLDRAIWHIRRYCYYMRGVSENKDGVSISLLDYELRMIHNKLFIKQPNKFKIYGGFLEKVIANNSKLAPHLIWNNFYYGRVKKHKIKNVKVRVSAANPTHFMHPEIINELNKLVNFPKELKKHFRATGKLTTG